ncbi:MAG: hypothetical protein JOZ69_03360, partial [Myxococcales bacterium]|nr:hypothetical protein [Myxococcales bacterium]
MQVLPQQRRQSKECNFLIAPVARKARPVAHGTEAGALVGPWPGAAVLLLRSRIPWISAFVVAIGPLACSGASPDLTLGGSEGGDGPGRAPEDAASAEDSPLDGADSGQQTGLGQADVAITEASFDAATVDASSTDASVTPLREAGPAAGPGDATVDAGVVGFAIDVYPIITERCIACHTPGGSGIVRGHLDLTTGVAPGAY